MVSGPVGNREAIPNGSTISIDAEGRFVFPPGSVLGKHFRLHGAVVETRLLCHTGVAGVSLGPELGQLNRDHSYPAQSANQLITLETIGLLADPLTDRQRSTVFYAIDDMAYSAERRARSYLHVNCATCHQPGGAGGGNLDLRMSASLSATGLCNQAPQAGNLGLITPVLLKPGGPDISILVLRRENLGETRMPPLSSSEIDTQAVAVVREWISGIENCH